MKSVNVVTAHYVVNDLACVVCCCLACRIQDKLSAISESPVRMLCCHVAVGERRRALCLGPERVNPRVQFHSATVALVYHPLQRIPIRTRRLALLSAEVATPRLIVTFVKGVALRTHLEDDGVHAVGFQHVELPAQLLLYHLRWQTFKLSVYGLDPCSTKLSLLGERA